MQDSTPPRPSRHLEPAVMPNKSVPSIPCTMGEQIYTSSKSPARAIKLRQTIAGRVTRFAWQLWRLYPEVEMVEESIASSKRAAFKAASEAANRHDL